MGSRYLHLRGEYIKGNLVQILREVEFIREGEGGEGGGKDGRRGGGMGGSERVESLSAAIHQSVESIRWN